MIWTIVAAAIAFLCGIWVAAQYGEHVSLQNREIEEPAAEKARKLSKEELDWALIHVRDDLGFIAAVLTLIAGLLSALIAVVLTQ